MATDTPVDIGDLIYADPAFRDGRPCIAGTGMSVARIVALKAQALTPEEIQVEYPHLSLAQIHAALAYYYLNRKQMDAQIAAESAEAERLYAEWKRRDNSPTVPHG